MSAAKHDGADIAQLNAERARVVRHYHRHSSEQRASHAASFRLTHGQRGSFGEYFFEHPEMPGVAFRTRIAAARAALAKARPTT